MNKKNIVVISRCVSQSVRVLNHIYNNLSPDEAKHYKIRREIVTKDSIYKVCNVNMCDGVSADIIITDGAVRSNLIESLLMQSSIKEGNRIIYFDDILNVSPPGCKTFCQHV